MSQNFFEEFRRNNEVQGGNIVLAGFNDLYIAVAFLFIFSNSSQTFFVKNKILYAPRRHRMITPIKDIHLSG
jgi:hypothetical protein